MHSYTKEVSNLRAGVKLSKENRVSGETSFRVYYGTNGAAVPFMWESRPGTPKHPIFGNSRELNDDFVPPLTPPPSYATTFGQRMKKRSKSRIFDRILLSVSRKNSHDTLVSSSSSPLSWSTTSSSSSSSISSPNSAKSHRRSVSFCSFGAKSTLYFGDVLDSDVDNMESPNSTKCFGFKTKNNKGVE
ncbi:hypothetical protein RND81_03G160600 [Saponaria officinalis]|uniref:Uncharacterized protein n=1 Tax=Saponaria officinalis TaxID=3572 RepID=A0AAW1M4C9_SAPOF